MKTFNPNFVTRVITTLAVLPISLSGVAPANAELLKEGTCRFEKIGQPILQMSCVVSKGNNGKLVISWADGAVDHYSFSGERNGITKVRDGLGSAWYVKASGSIVNFQHESGDREVYIF